MAYLESDRERAVQKKARYYKQIKNPVVRVILTVISLTICPFLIYTFFTGNAAAEIGNFRWVVLAGIIVFMLFLLSLGLQGVKGIAFSLMFRDAGDDMPEDES